MKIRVFISMKKFIITEEEKQRILGLYENIGDPLIKGGAESSYGQATKKIAQALNGIYNINLSSANDGNWNDKEYNDTLKKFMQERNIPIWECKANDGYCPPNSDGIVTTKDLKKLGEELGLNQTNPQNKKLSINTAINTIHDKKYDYKVEKGKYYFKGKEGTPTGIKYPNWVEATGKGLEAIKKTVKFE